MTSMHSSTSMMVKATVILMLFLFEGESFRMNVLTHSRRVSRSTVSMNMFERFSRVVSSNVNSVLKGLEDPEKVIEQAVLDMQNDLIKIRQSYAEISATTKRMEKQRDVAASAAEEWYRRAQLALEKGDEELAREALSRRQIQKDLDESLTGQINMQSSASDKLYTSMSSLEGKITEAKREKEMLIAKARTAKTSLQVNDMLNTVGSGTSAMDAFERMKTKVDSLESQAEVAGELAASSSGTTVKLEDRFKALEGNTKVDDELAAMRRSLPGIAKTPEKMAELPAPSASAEPKSELDMEYERLKKELRG